MDNHADDGGTWALKPLKGSPGEWHDFPMGEFEPVHYENGDCGCDPELRVTTNEETEELRSVWVHKRVVPVQRQ